MANVVRLFGHRHLLSHPDNSCFGVAKVERDQAEDYARRKRMALEEVEGRLGSILD
jgi:5-methyltetrahydrofolate--homocysteine methyltransferase